MKIQDSIDEVVLGLCMLVTSCSDV